MLSSAHGVTTRSQAKKLRSVFLNYGIKLCQENETEKVINLLEKNTPTPAELNSFMAACTQQGHVDCLSVLLTTQPQARQALKLDAEPLLNALYWWNHNRNNCACVKLLLKAGANANAATAYNNTALHLACKRGCLKCIKRLIKFGARILAENFDKETPIEIFYNNYEEFFNEGTIDPINLFISMVPKSHDEDTSEDEDTPEFVNIVTESHS